MQTDTRELLRTGSGGDRDAPTVGDPRSLPERFASVIRDATDHRVRRMATVLKRFERLTRERRRTRLRRFESLLDRFDGVIRDAADHRVRRMATVLKRFERLTRERRRARLRRFESLLDRFEPLLAEVRARRKRTAERFNLFDALGVWDREATHSRFLAYLLDPSGLHDQEDRLLQRFLKMIGLDFDPESTRSAVVTTEQWLGDYGQVDICIRLVNGQIVLIENKVHADEGHRQIARYQDWLHEQTEPQDVQERGGHRLVFLTLDGKAPTSTSRPEGVTCISYPEVADWIDRCAHDIKGERPREELEQYAQLCRRLAGTGTPKGQR